MPLINDDGAPFNPLATVGKPEGLIVTRDEFSPPIREGGPIQSDPMGQRGTPTIGETVGASFRLENEVVGAVRALTRDRDFGDEDPEHNPWDTIKDTKYQDYWQAFTSARNAAETESIRARIDQELEDRRIREASGVTGFISDMVAGVLSPTNIGPLALAGRIYRGYGAASAAARSAAAVSGAATVGVAIQEAALQSQQLTRTWQESMLNIGGATVLGGLLGGGASYFSSRALSRAARQIDDDIVRLRTETADISAMTSRVDPQSVGAATSRTVQENIPASAYGLEQLFSFQGPLTRTLASEIRSARDVMTRLAEIPFKLRQNKEGIPTGPAGGSVEGRIKTEGDVALYRASESLHKGFAEYRYGNADAKFAKSRAAFNDMLKPAQGRMNWRDYKSEITKALRSETGKGIEHPIPQVKAAAEAFRKEVFEPFKKEAQKLGLFPEDAEFSFNYVMRRYDINAILNDYARFKQILVDHLKGGQAKARAELAKIEREIAASRTEGDISGDVDALRQQFEAERARVQEARSAQSNIKESMDADREYLDALTQAKGKTAEERAILDAERLDVETRIADEKAAERRIRAFHGSPHEFDKFDMSHMGRGEGTQFEGHGLYFSTSEDVAKGYRDVFARGGDGRLYEVQINIPDDRLAKWFAPIDDQSPAIRSALESMPELAVLRSPVFKAYEAADAKVRENRRLINDLRDKKMFDSDELATALDRELILKKEFRVEAAKLVKAAGIKQGSSADFALSAGIFDLDGKLVFNRLYDLVAASPSEASAAFRRAGILGSEYQGGGGAKNIVVYDDSLVEIVSRDGVPVKPQEAQAAKAEMAQGADATPEPPKVELDPAVIQAVEGMAARLGIQMPDLRGLDLDAMMQAVSKSISDMTGMSQQGGKSSADLKTLMSKRDELRYIADASDDELGSIAADTISTITGSPAARGVNPYSAELLEGTSGPLKARTLKIPDEKIVDFLDDDIERIAQQYVRAMAPDVAIVREFGDLNLTEDLKRIQDEANAKMDANPERAADLQAQSVRAQKDLQAVVARLRGTYNIAHDPTSYGPRAAQVAKQANVLRLMGAVLASSIADVPKLLFVHGFRQNADLFGTMIQNLGNLKMAKAEAKELSAGLEFVLSRSGQMWDAFEDMAGHTFGERALRVATNKMGRLTLMDQWNATFKQLSGIMTMNRVLRASVDLVNGRIKPKEMEKLAASGIGDEMAERIAAQYQKHGTVYGRLFLPNANEWDDSLARQALSSAVRREADLTITTPGQERPLWTSGTYGSVVGQFRTFQMISIQRTLIAGLQDMDAAKVSAMAMMISLGMLSEQLKSIIHGKDGKNLPKDMGDWMYVGMANSGILGWLTDADQMAHKVSRGNISLGKFAFGRDAPTARFASQNAIGSLLGPTYGAGADIIQAIGAASAGEVRESDIHAMRRLMPYQNLFYISRALRAFEEGMIDAAGVPRTQRRN